MESELYQDRHFLQEFIDATCLMINLSMQVIDKNRLCVAAAGADSVKNCVGKYSRADGAIARLYLKGMRRVTIIKPGESENCIGCKDYQSCPRSLYHTAVFGPIEVDNEIIGVVGIMANDDTMLERISENESNAYAFVESIARLIAHRIIESKHAAQVSTLTSLLSKTISTIPQGIIVLDENHQVMMINDVFKKRVGEDVDGFLGKHISALFKKLDNDYLKKHLSDHHYHELHYKNYHFTAEFVSFSGSEETRRLLIYLDESKSSYSRAWEMTDTAINIDFQDILSEDPNFLKFKQQVRSVAPYNSTVLLIGETGTGKELFARAIHNTSPRRREPFVAVNCGAIPDSLIESELFGYDKGAFTGASSQGKHGKFFMANGGTLFLDEVENTPLYMQQKLLRVLETSEFERVGGTRSIKVDVRVIAASNGKLDELVENGSFRRDLFHRLSVLPFLIPPLRDRGNDCILLAEAYIRRYNIRYQKQIQGISEDFKKFILHYSWNGNVRELQNVIEYAVSMCSGDELVLENLPYHMQHAETQVAKERSLREVELEYIQKIIRSTGFDEDGRRRAAEILGISQATIYRKLKEIASEK